MPTNEKAMNAYIAEALEAQAPPGCRVSAEQTGAARLGNTSPDFIVSMPYGLRVIIESEYGAPAVKDAVARLGYEFNDYQLPMKSVIALGIPREMGEMGHAERRAALASDEPRFSMRVVTGKSPDDPAMSVVPDKPIPVSLRDLVQYAWLAAIPAPYADEIMAEAVAGMSAAQDALAARLRALPRASQERLAKRYGSHDSANKMAAVAGNVAGTLFSMIQLHVNLKTWGGLEDALNIDDRTLWQRVEPRDGLPDRIAREWRTIESVNYMPLSTIASEMLEDSDVSPQIGGTLRATRRIVADYVNAGVSATTNVAAEIWQSLIPDRDSRAAYYTKPETAELLANIATKRLARPGDANYNEVCAGTGTLARATEENIRFRHYAESPDKTSVHARRMGRNIQLTDINPQSVSVATANMASLEPSAAFETDGIFAITAEGGSLNFLTEGGVSDMQSSLIGRTGASEQGLVVGVRSTHICCNNDPYFRARGGASSPIGKSAMSKYKRAADRRVKGVANAQAGLATFMHAIEHTMLESGGVHGKVLPLTAAHAQTYTGFRRNMEREYNDVIAICTAAGEGDSMSADTGIQEMLLIGTKHAPSVSGIAASVSGAAAEEAGDRAVTCVNLTAPFKTKLEAKMFADAIAREAALGEKHGEIAAGSVIGTYYRMEGLGEGRPWSALGISGDYAVLSEFVRDGAAWNPSTGEIVKFALPMTTLSGVADIGPTHHLLGGVPTSRNPGGAFVMRPRADARNRVNPSMWELDAKTQLSITCVPTHYGEPRDDADEAARMLKTAGRFHISRNLRTSAQTIAACYTEADCVGGRSWTTLYADEDAARAITLFLNSVYGMLIRVGYGQSTDLGRSPIQVRAIGGHPVPDFGADTPAARTARETAAENFDRLRTLPLKRIALCALDENRAEIDRVVTLMLGLPWDMRAESALDTWRRLMCLQPAVNGNNKTTLRTLAAAGIAAESGGAKRRLI